ncbi:MAG: DUF1295 domain-containing protein [Planctomycetes bacterium]|nr:DUF1295 domain-containing protein [Planctomycetota bacterium]
MNCLELLALNIVLTLALMTVLWGVSLVLRDVSIVDVFWGLGFVVIASLCFFLTEEITVRKTLLLLLTSIWGLRLSIYLALRKFGTPEDYRYQAMRAWIGHQFWLVSLFLVFGLQGILMNIVALPVVMGQLDTSPIGFWAVLGVALWTVGLVFEAVGDYQLALFKADVNNRGKVLDQGLWRYTRHPNYFGDFLVWWGIFFAAQGQGSWWTVIGPLVMSFLLIRVSGVALLERSLKNSKEGYEDYMARTSAFIPWPPHGPKT